RAVAPFSRRESCFLSPFVRPPTRRKCRHSDLCPEAWRWFESPARLLVGRSCGPHNSTTFHVAISLFLYFFILPEKIQRKRLQDEHAIAVAVKAIPVTDRFVVRMKNEF